MLKWLAIVACLLVVETSAECKGPKCEKMNNKNPPPPLPPVVHRPEMEGSASQMGNHVIGPFTEYWPDGRYALPGDGFSCPGGFRESVRYQDTEDYCNANEWDEYTYFKGPFKQDGLLLHYCTKTNFYDGYGNGTSMGPWPSGNYCIHRQGRRCPEGFEVGSIYWDDEDTNNANRRSGRLPSGRYDSDTKQYFCCRSDGPATTPISLPMYDTFFLYRYTGQCQEVANMVWTEERILFDDEDDNNANFNTGSHPKDTGSSEGHRLHYCHYKYEDYYKKK